MEEPLDVLGPDRSLATRFNFYSAFAQNVESPGAPWPRSGLGVAVLLRRRTTPGARKKGRGEGEEPTSPRRARALARRRHPRRRRRPQGPSGPTPCPGGACSAPWAGTAPSPPRSQANPRHLSRTRPNFPPDFRGRHLRGVVEGGERGFGPGRRSSALGGGAEGARQKGRRGGGGRGGGWGPGGGWAGSTRGG